MGEKRKWFDQKIPAAQFIAPGGWPPVAELDEFQATLRELVKRDRITNAQSCTLRHLGAVPPTLRLSMNLTRTLHLLRDGQATDTGIDGLLKSEYDTLVAITKAGMSIRHQEVAQQLLNVTERYQLVRSLSYSFKKARQNEGEYYKE
jgi:hypothetical protein